MPHLYYNGGEYFITYRLADTIPLKQILHLHEQIKLPNDDPTNKEKKIFKKYDELLDKNENGIKYLLDEKIAGINRDKLQSLDNTVYKLICYCIMPNHIHLVFRLLNETQSVSDVMKLIKGSTSREGNKVLNKTGKFWQVESFDRLIRDANEMYNIINYVLNNPVKAGLVSKPEDWKYSYCNPDFFY
ncbi:MAG: transposase [Ignavibacteriaceae bacterium]